MVENAANIWADGPSSMPFQPQKSQIRAWGTWIERFLAALAAGQGGDIKLPELIYRYTVTGGSGNAITAEPNAAPPAAAGAALLTMMTVAENTGPMTLNGKPLRANGGEELVAGEVKPGDLLAFLDLGAEYRLLTDPGSLRNKEAAVAAQLAANDERLLAEAARDIAAGYASDAVSQGNVPIYATAVGMAALSVPVGINAIRVNGYAAAGDGGGAMYIKADGEPVHAGKFQTSDGAWWALVADYVTPAMFGAHTAPNTIDASRVNSASDYLKLRGGGRVVYPSGRYHVVGTIIVDDNIDHRPFADGCTVLEIPPGAGTDIFRTRDFALYSGQSTLPSSPPKGFSIKGFELQGNYLDFSSSDWRTADTVLNAAGSGVKIYGYEFELDVKVYNFAEHGAWTEGRSIGFEANREHACKISVGGRIFRKEGFVFKGPGDSEIIYNGMGLAGLLTKTERLTAVANPSSLYAGYGVAGTVLDNANGNEGHAEIAFMHNYGCFYGFGVLALGVNRFNARHVAIDNSLGGFGAPDSAHGVIAILEARACGRKPDAYAGSDIVPLPDIFIRNGQIFQLSGQMRVSKYGASIETGGVPSVSIEGNNGNYTISYHSDLTEDLDPYQVSRALSVTGNNNTIRYDAKRVKGDAVFVSGRGNNISGSVESLFSGRGLVRDNSGGVAYANNVDLVISDIRADATGFQSMGVAPIEQIRLTLTGAAGFSPFAGDAPSVLSRGQIWEVVASVGNSVVGQKMTADYAEASLDISDAAQKTVVIDHQFLYTPVRSQVSWSLFHAATTPPDAALEYLYLSAISATQLTFKYKWQTAPTTGSAPVIAVNIR